MAPIQPQVAMVADAIVSLNPKITPPIIETPIPKIAIRIEITIIILLN